jgi:DNA polymerase-3 subunit beta
MKDLPHPQFQIISRLIEGEYPNYQAIIPSKFKTHIILKRDEFLNQIKAASLFSGKISEVKIIVGKDKNEVEIFSKDPDIGENRSTISAKITGEDQEVSFNYKFLIDGLNNIKSSEVVFELSEKEGPCVLKPVGDLSYLYVVMPIKST